MVEHEWHSLLCSSSPCSCREYVVKPICRNFSRVIKLSHKNCLVENLKRFWKRLEARKFEATKCAFIPEIFKMPSEYHLFVEEFCKNPGVSWILKLLALEKRVGGFELMRNEGPVSRQG
ncbi:putative tubulin polyglutamylase TTLL9 [Pterocles gutturalis]